MNRSPLEKDETLNILSQLEKSPHTTQRTLSKKLGVSLGKINFLLRALIRKGFIKTRRFKNSKNKLSFLYLLTPHGMKQKTQITHRFLKKKIEEYNHLKQEINQLKEEINKSTTKF